MTRRALAALGLLALGSPGRPPHAAAAPQEQATPRFGTGSEVVVLDVVVRDKRGRTLRDLRPDEIVVLEDGVPQQVLSFRLRAAGDAPAAEADDAASAAPPAIAPHATPASSPAPERRDDARHVNLVTLVFDQLGVDGRALSRKAGLALAGLTDKSDLLVSVFTIRDRLSLVQQFTSERARVEAAVLDATGSLDVRYPNATDMMRAAAESQREAEARLESAAAASAVEAGTLASLGREAAMARMAVDALRMTDTLQREQQGQSSLYSLLSLARQQHRLAGRKTILFFSEGIQVPPSLEHVFRSTISESNRANVSIYTIDARGLREERDLEATRQVLEQAAAAAQRSMTSRGLGAVPKDQVLALDDAERSLRLDLQGALSDLAESTGGALIANSNDVRKGIERAVGDLQGYYEVIYAPSNGTYDGRFRTIQVKLARSGARVQARSGYFALPPGEGSASFPFEVDLLKALRAYPLPEELPLRVNGFRFGPEPGGVRYTAVIELPLAGITFEPDDRGETDRAHFSMLLVIRDATGAVVEKFTEDSPVSLPRTRRAALKQGNAVFLRSFALPAGRYTLEAAVVDQLARRYGTRRSLLEVARPGAGLELSELVLIKRSESVPAGALASEDPFRQGGTRLVPWLSEPHLGRGEVLSLFAVAYPRKDGPPGDVLLEFLRDGALVAQSLTQLSAVGEQGRAAFVAGVPLQELAAGRYEVRVLVKQGGLVAQRRAHFVLDETATQVSSH
jgi:VWFA-related protein